MYRLKEKCGNHIGPPDAKGNRKTYTAGDKVTSDDDLVEKWSNKFVLVSPDEYKGAVKAPKIPNPKRKKSKDKDVEYNKDGSVYKDMEDPVNVNKESKTSVPEESEHGIDVTADFPTALKVNLIVFEKLKWYTVVDPDNNEVLNEKKLRQSKVEPFLAEYLQDDDDKTTPESEDATDADDDEDEGDYEDEDDTDADTDEDDKDDDEE